MYGTILIGFNLAKVKSGPGRQRPVAAGPDLQENISKLKQCGVALLDSPSEICPLTLAPGPQQRQLQGLTRPKPLLMKIRPYIHLLSLLKYMADTSPTAATLSNHGEWAIPAVFKPPAVPRKPRMA